MNPVFRKMQTVVTQALVRDRAASVCRVSPLIQHTVCGGSVRQHKAMPTHGIGKWKHFLLKEAPRKKRDKLQMKPVVAPTPTAFGSLCVQVSGLDMTLVEHYSQYIHNFCRRLGVEVSDSYALPTRTTEVQVLQDQSTKMHVDAILKTHRRVVQLSSLDTSLCPLFLDVLLKNQPEGVELSIKEYLEEDFQVRFKARPELEGLMAQMGR